MVTCLDEAVGTVVSKLKAKAMWQDTLFIFFSDNGGDIIQGSSNWPLRGAKQTPWEGGVRSVAQIAGGWSGIEDSARGSHSHALVHVTDLYPSIVAAAKVAGVDKKVDAAATSPRPTLPLDGINVLPSITSGLGSIGSSAATRKEMLVHVDHVGYATPQRIARSGGNLSGRVGAIVVWPYKLIEGLPGRGDWYPTDPTLCWTEDYVYGPDATDYTQFEAGDGGQKELFGMTKDKREPSLLKQLWLFNVEEDPEERRDLSLLMPEKVAELRQRLRVYELEQVPPANFDFMASLIDPSDLRNSAAIVSPGSAWPHFWPWAENLPPTSSRL
jgi:arylsulfatase A-like enzyme